MRFGSAPLDEARGAIMAHSQKIGDRMIRKGSVLDEEAIAGLRAAGQAEVICARLDPGDVPEDRMGVRGSIVDRMQRHGGSAEIRSERGDGTEVRLRLPRKHEESHD